MNDLVFELDSDGVRELLQSPEMVSVISDMTAIVAGNAGDGYEYDTQVHNRVVGRVWAESKEAKRDNEDNNTLLRSLHG